MKYLNLANMSNRKWPPLMWQWTCRDILPFTFFHCATTSSLCNLLYHPCNCNSFQNSSLTLHPFVSYTKTSDYIQTVIQKHLSNIYFIAMNWTLECWTTHSYSPFIRNNHFFFKQLRINSMNRTKHPSDIYFVQQYNSRVTIYHDCPPFLPLHGKKTPIPLFHDNFCILFSTNI